MKNLDCYKIIKSEIRTIITKTGKSYRKRVLTIQCPDCQNIYDKIHYHERSSRCKSCAALKQNADRKGKKGYKDIGDLNGSFVRMYKFNASKRKLPFEITSEFMWNLYLKQKGKCKLSGLPINLKVKYKQNLKKNGTHLDRSMITASLDRINSKLGYIEGNVQWVHKVVNIMKGNLTDNDFIYFCKQVNKTNLKDNTEPRLLNGGNYFRSKVQRLMGEEPTNNPNTSTPQPNQSELVEDIV